MDLGQFDIRNHQRFYFHATPLRKSVIFLVSRIMKLFMELEVLGLENLPTVGAVIIAANHVTNFDVLPMQLALPRPIFYMGKAELFRIPVMGTVFRNMGAFPVYRGEKDQWALTHAARVLEHGEILGMFPEGTRSRGAGLGVAKTGSARLAIEAGCMIIPMAIIGSDKFFHRFPRRNHVTVHILPALKTHNGETPLSLTERLMFTLAAELPVPMRGVYGQIPEGFKLKREADPRKSNTGRLRSGG